MVLGLDDFDMNSLATQSCSPALERIPSCPHRRRRESAHVEMVLDAVVDHNGHKTQRRVGCGGHAGLDDAEVAGAFLVCCRGQDEC
jgi:hypothetical protein